MTEAFIIHEPAEDEADVEQLTTPARQK